MPSEARRRDRWSERAAEGRRTQRIIAADHTPETLSMLSAGLTRCGYEVTTYTNGESALRALRSENPDLMVLDLELPNIDGAEICTRVREWSSVPIIMLTESGSVADRVRGLRAGADDCVSKPFSFEELVARIEAALRRHPREQQQLEYEDLVIDFERHRCLRAGSELDLTPTEFRMLETLARLPERVISRRTLANAVWPQSDRVYDNLIDVHVTNLRKKLEAVGGRRLVQTIRGVGYALR